MSLTTTEDEKKTTRRPAGVDAPVALVVDGDAVSRRFVELALTSGGSFFVEVARDGAAALDILAAERVDLVVAEMDLPDTSGVGLLRRLGQEQRLRGIPFVFLTSEARSEARVAAFRAGADDCLTKPVRGEELLARTEALVGRRRRERDQARARTYTLAGDFETLSFPDIVSIVGMGRRSGVLSVLAARSTGTVIFDDGAPVHALFGNLAGVDAFNAIVLELSGTFEFTPGPCVLAPRERTIQETGTALLLEAARIFDESSTGLMMKPSVAAPLREIALDASDALVPALVPSSALAAQLEMALREPFALGEPRLWSEEQLAKWTEARGSNDRLHVHVIADLATGVSSLLGLAGAPTERWILDGLASNPKAFGLTFFLRHERVIDVVLLDVNDPAGFADHLRRVPALTVVAPAGGDFMSVGTKARVALHSLLERLTPRSLVGVGNGALEVSLRGLGVPPSCALRCTPGALGEDSCDLRSVLLRGIRLWGSTAPRADGTSTQEGA